MPAGSQWIRRFHPAEEATARVVCLPHAGGSASFYFPLSRALTPSLDVLAVQYPGRQDRHAEPCVDELGKLADLVVDELAPWLDRPLVLFGHSMGATLAFEVATRLRRRGVVPLRLFASGRRAPSTHRDESTYLLDDDALVADVFRMAGDDMELPDEELVRMMLPAIRNDYKAAETYRYHPGEPLSCPITVLTGDRDPKVTAEEAAAWKAHTTAGCEVRTFSGGHFFLAPHLAEITRLVGEAARGARGTSGS
ncbi:thioesterase II family protein [Streptomyces ipomoeae]|uniref:thioesterase II family protein n=1 Tax=Streptomyces ipomoeae TaxID=103232 RepID=UPI001146B978|nr:alpha/beta fold hydrolase [Streptomyces ipomoeae]MDX2939352.1 alpha/beta fold hydrolase [Streptomyces ipomoeae]TQE25197.1 thioesterase [Streptomyces ipomoeae]